MKIIVNGQKLDQPDLLILSHSNFQDIIQISKLTQTHYLCSFPIYSSKQIINQTVYITEGKIKLIYQPIKVQIKNEKVIIKMFTDFKDLDYQCDIFVGLGIINDRQRKKFQQIHQKTAILIYCPFKIGGQNTCENLLLSGNHLYNLMFSFSFQKEYGTVISYNKCALQYAINKTIQQNCLSIMLLEQLDNEQYQKLKKIKRLKIVAFNQVKIQEKQIDNIYLIKSIKTPFKSFSLIQNLLDYFFTPSVKLFKIITKNILKYKQTVQVLNKQKPIIQLIDFSNIPVQSQTRNFIQPIQYQYQLDQYLKLNMDNIISQLIQGNLQNPYTTIVNTINYKSLFITSLKKKKILQKDCKFQITRLKNIWIKNDH